MNIKKSLGLAGFAVLGMLPVSCKDYKSSYEGYPTELNDGILFIRDKEGRKGEIMAIDRDKDGRYDEIYLNTVPKGSDFERLANLRTLQEIDKYVRSVENKTSSALNAEK